LKKHTPISASIHLNNDSKEPGQLAGVVEHGNTHHPIMAGDALQRLLNVGHFVFPLQPPGNLTAFFSLKISIFFGSVGLTKKCGERGLRERCPEREGSMRVSSAPRLWPFGAAVDEQERVASDSHPSLPTSSTCAGMPHAQARGSLSTVRSQHGSGYAAFDGCARMLDVARIMGRSASHNRASWLRAAALVLVSAALCALAYSCLADDAASSRISGRGSRVSRVDEMQQRRQMLDFDDGDGGSFGDSDGNSDGGEFGDSFLDADDLENSGSYVGYLAWSDTKLQHVLNSTHTRLWQMVHQWNRTYSPAHVGGMKHKVWLLQNAFSRHGYLLDDAEHGLENLHQLTKKAMREVQGATAALNPKVNAELRHIINHTHALVARGARADLEQGRKLIKAEQIDLNTDASVRRKVKEAQQLLVALKSRVHNVTSTMLASALAWGDFAAADMRSPKVCICVNIYIFMFASVYLHICIYLCTYTCKFMFINV